MRQDLRFPTKSIWAKWALMVLLLVQSLTFSGFSDVAPSRDSGTRSEWRASFSVRRHKTVSFVQANRSGAVPREKNTLLFEAIRHRQNNRYLTWLATVCAARVSEPHRYIPRPAWPRSADEEYRS